MIDASRVAQGLGLGNRINTILQTCFFALSGVLPREEAIARIKAETEKTYARKGAEVVKKNFEAIDTALANLVEVEPPKRGKPGLALPPAVPADAPEFVRTVTAPMLLGRGDTLPVSLLPADGTYPSGTTRYEKRNVADEVPVWEPQLCIQCGQCAVVCPHSVIRAKTYDRGRLEGAPPGFKAVETNARGYPDSRYTLQVYVEDCTGCGVCVENCPAREPGSERRAINMRPRLDVLEDERRAVGFFETLPWVDRTRVNFSNVRGVQFLEPLFEFPGACAGCGETPYLKLISQLFGDRAQIANATGCSSIYGGNLPTTPWTHDAAGRGPAWSNSLFEDNAEFGLGYRIAIDAQCQAAHALARKLAAAHRRGPGRRADRGAAAERVRFPPAARAPGGAQGGAGRDAGRPRRAQPARAGGLLRAPLGVDRGRRRLGLRHRLRRPRPCARLGPQRQHPGARHRGLLQHRRPGLEVDPARRLGEVRRRRQDLRAARTSA